MSWQGLWFTFARLENVVGAFNANKLSRTEKNWFREDIEDKVKKDFRKVKPVGENFTKPSEVERIVVAASEWDSKEVRKITGFVEQEDLGKLKRCLVGEMSTVCSVKSIVDRLHNLGLADIKVQRMSGKHYLLSFDDDELYIMLEDLNWSYMKEIFSEVGLWLEEWIYKYRATWIEVYGMPLYCWNHSSLTRVAELW
ncbi:hypothetical protein V6N13_041163 [Hibiscus sabdariffa]